MVEMITIEQKFSQGEVFFISDFNEVGTYEGIRKALQRLTAEAAIGRIAKGVYFLPKKHERFGVLQPHAEQVAQAIAKRDKARIMPTGASALHKLGLSTQVPLKAVYLTDGSPRHIALGNQTIQFKKTTPKMLSIRHELSSLIVQALKAIGEKNVTKEQIDKIQEIIQESGEEELVFRNLTLAPMWIQKLIMKK